jgi:hypothetical protein
LFIITILKRILDDYLVSGAEVASALAGDSGFWESLNADFLALVNAHKLSVSINMQKLPVLSVFIFEPKTALVRLLIPCLPTVLTNVVSILENCA